MNKFLRYLLIGNLLWCFGEGLLGPLYAVFVERVGGDPLEISGAYATYLIVMGILSIFVGQLSVKYSKRKLMVIGCAINTVATFGYLLVDDVTKMFILQALFGIAYAFEVPTWNSLFSIHVDRFKECEEWGFNDGGIRIVSGLALVLGGVIVTYLGFATLFILMGIVQLLSTIVHALVYTQPVKYKRKSR